jgi:ketosteroid isomerase-like protein
MLVRLGEEVQEVPRLGHVAGDHVETLRAVYDEWARGNFRTGVDLFDPDLVFSLRPEFPDANTYHGPEGLSGYMRMFLTSWNDLTMTAEEFIEADGSVVVAVYQRGIGRESGTPVELRYFQVWTFRGPKVIRFESIRTRAEALEVVGLG